MPSWAVAKINFNIFYILFQDNSQNCLFFSATNCAAIGCLVELCPNGEMPPVPPGQHRFVIIPSGCHHIVVMLVIWSHIRYTIILSLGRSALYNFTIIMKLCINRRDGSSIPDICHIVQMWDVWRKICHVEKFQISLHVEKHEITPNLSYGVSDLYPWTIWRSLTILHICHVETFQIYLHIRCGEM